MLAGLPELLCEFDDEEVDKWAVAAWLVSPTMAMEGISPLETIRTERDDISRVHALARDALQRWTQ